MIIVGTKGQTNPIMSAFSLVVSAYSLALVSNWNKNILEMGSNMASAQSTQIFQQEAVLPGLSSFGITRGQIQFSDVSMRYRENLTLSLEGLNFTITAGHKVGIMGRTGSGKSSVLQVLFRLVNPEREPFLSMAATTWKWGCTSSANNCQ